MGRQEGPGRLDHLPLQITWNGKSVAFRAGGLSVKYRVARGMPPIFNTPTIGCIGAEESRLPLQDLLISIQGDFLGLDWEQNISAAGRIAGDPDLADAHH